MEPNRTRETVQAANDIAFRASMLWGAWVLLYGQHGGDPDLSERFRARRIAARRSARLANREHAAICRARREARRRAYGAEALKAGAE